MKILYIQLVILIYIGAFTGCDNISTNSSKKSNIESKQTIIEVPSEKDISLINIYGKLPDNRKSDIEVIFDINNNGVVDQNETNHKFIYHDLSQNYLLDKLNIYNASKMWITYSSNHSIPHKRVVDITTDNYNINIENYTLEEKINVPIDRDEAYKYIVFIIKENNNKLEIFYLYSPQKSIDDATTLFELAIPIEKLSTNITSINAYFNNYIDNTLHRPHTINDENLLLNIYKSISYSLYDQDNKPIILDKSDIFTKFNTKSIDMSKMSLFRFDNQRLEKISDTNQSSISLKKSNKVVVKFQKILAKNSEITKPKNICIRVEDSKQTPINSVLVEGHSDLDISSRYSDDNGKATLQIYQDISSYTFDYSIDNLSVYNKSFTLLASNEANCSYSTTITIDNSHLQSLNIKVIGENNISIQKEYIYIYNSDFSFYRYGYLDINGSIILNVPKDEPLTIVIGNQKYTIEPNTKSKTLYYTKDEHEPKLYQYFDKENINDDFPKLYVMAVGDNLDSYTPAVVQKSKNYGTTSSLLSTKSDIYDDFRVYTFPIDEKMPLLNDFDVVFTRSNPSSVGMHILGSIHLIMHSHAGAMGTRNGISFY